MSIIYEQLFRKINSLIPALENIEEGEGTKLKAAGFMDLSVDILHRTPDKTIIALAHYYKQNGDLVPDPDMEVAIYPKLKQAEALSYQDSFGYRSVYPEEGFVNLKAKKDLNSFLNSWLNNLKQQGHKPDATEKGSDFER